MIERKGSYREVVVTDPRGPFCSTPPRSYSALSIKSGAHISSWLSLLNDSSRAPATVPDASIRESFREGDQVKVAVLWISFSFMMDV